MTKNFLSNAFVKPVFGQRASDPLAQMMAGFTGFAVAVTLILATAIPVQANRKPAFCANDLTEMALPCGDSQ